MYEKMRAERQRLAQEIASLKARLKELPLSASAAAVIPNGTGATGISRFISPKNKKSWQNGWLRKSICRRGWKSFCRNKKLLISI